MTPAERAAAIFGMRSRGHTISKSTLRNSTEEGKTNFDAGEEKKSGYTKEESDLLIAKAKADLEMAKAGIAINKLKKEIREDKKEERQEKKEETQTRVDAANAKVIEKNLAEQNKILKLRSEHPLIETDDRAKWEKIKEVWAGTPELDAFVKTRLNKNQANIKREASQYQNKKEPSEREKHPIIDTDDREEWEKIKTAWAGSPELDKYIKDIIERSKNVRQEELKRQGQEIADKQKSKGRNIFGILKNIQNSGATILEDRKFNKDKAEAELNKLYRIAESSGNVNDAKRYASAVLDAAQKSGVIYRLKNGKYEYTINKEMTPAWLKKHLAPGENERFDVGYGKNQLDKNIGQQVSYDNIQQGSSNNTPSVTYSQAVQRQPTNNQNRTQEVVVVQDTGQRTLPAISNIVRKVEAPPNPDYPANLLGIPRSYIDKENAKEQNRKNKRDNKNLIPLDDPYVAQSVRGSLFITAAGRSRLYGRKLLGGEVSP